MKKTKGELLSSVMLNELELLKDFKKHRIIVSVGMEPLGFEDDWEDRPGFMELMGYFSLAYAPEENSSRPFKIHAMDGVARRNVYPNRYKSWEAFEEEATSGRNKMANFLIRATNISKELFDVALKNYGCRIPFCVDVVKYNAIAGESNRFSTRQNLYGIAYMQDKKSAMEKARQLIEDKIDPFSGKPLR